MIPLQAVGQEFGSLFLIVFVVLAITYTIYRFTQGYRSGKS